MFTCLARIPHLNIILFNLQFNNCQAITLRMAKLILIILFHSTLLGFFHLTSIMNFGVTLSDFMLLAFYMLTLKTLIYNNKVVEVSIFSGLIFTGLFILSTLTSAIYPIFSDVPGTSIQIIKTLVHFYYLAFFAVAILVMKFDDQTWKLLIRIWLIISIFINIYAVYQLIARAFDLPGGWIEFNIEGATSRTNDLEKYESAIVLKYENFYRATSIFSEPSSLAFYNITNLTFLVIPWINKLTPIIKTKIVSLVTILLALIGLLLTFSLTGLSTLTLLLFSNLLIEKKKNYRFYLSFIFGGIAFLILSDIVVRMITDVSVLELFYNRIEGILSTISGKVDKTVTGESYGFRLRSIFEGLRIGSLNYLTGVGLGNTYLYSSDPDIIFIDAGLFGIFAEAGFFGAISYLLMYITIAYNAYYLNKRTEDKDRYLVNVVLYLNIVLGYAHMVISNQYVQTFAWLMIGFSLAILNKRFIQEGKDFIRFKFSEMSLKKVFTEKLNKAVNQEQASH